MTPEIRFRLEDMVGYAVEAIGILGAATASEVSADAKLRYALTYLVQVVGEAASRTPKPFQAQHPEIPWSSAIGQRHILVHGYSKVLADEIVRTVREDFPPLVANLNKLLLEADAP